MVRERGADVLHPRRDHRTGPLGSPQGGSRHGDPGAEGGRPVCLGPGGLAERLASYPKRKEFAGDEAEQDTITAMIRSRRDLADRLRGKAVENDAEEEENDDLAPATAAQKRKRRPKARATPE